MGLFKKHGLRVRCHRAYFVGENKKQYLFINVTNRSQVYSYEITHLWNIGGYYPINPKRPLPHILGPQESWETWVDTETMPSSCGNHWETYTMWRVRTSTGKIFKSKENTNVPAMGTVPGAKRRTKNG